MSPKELEKEYKKTYTEELGDGEFITGQVIVRYKLEKGNILDFSLSLNYVKSREEKPEEKYEVYRADTSNGDKEPHEHLLWRNKNQERSLQGHSWKDFNHLFNQILSKVDENFLRYIMNYKNNKGV